MSSGIRFTGRKKPEAPKEPRRTSLEVDELSFSKGDTIVNKGQTYIIKNITDKIVALDCIKGAYENTKNVNLGVEGFKQRVRSGELYKKNGTEKLEDSTVAKIRTTIKK